jgi:hypothetical protein
LEQWEEQAWDSLNFEQAPPGYVKYNTPIKRTNDLLCVVFSCFTDPRSPASTDALLSLRVRRFSTSESAANCEGTLGGTEAGPHTPRQFHSASQSHPVRPGNTVPALQCWDVRITGAGGRETRVQMLTDGVKLGQRGDGRVSADSLLNNTQDVLQKLDDYLGLIDRVQRYYE